MTERSRKILFRILIAINFIMITVYLFLTPTMSDDVIYMDEVARANSFFDIFVQEYNQYMTHTGRSVAHIILRTFLYIGSKPLFNIAASAVFTLLSVLIYLNVDHRKKYDIRLYAGIMGLAWLMEPTISNSVLWETGACNYLFTGTIVLLYITLFRQALQREKKTVFAAGMFILGLLAGWCNENTSGGVILFSIMMLVIGLAVNKKPSFIKPWMITGLIGNLAGFIIMIIAPGNANRRAAAHEEHSGLLALIARFLKISNNIKDYYLVLVLAYIVLMIFIAVKCSGRDDFIKKAGTMILFGIMFLATDYALIAVPYSQLRTYFGGWIFLTIGIMEGFAVVFNCEYKDSAMQALSLSLVTCAMVILTFTYIEQGANLARIKREFDEREVWYRQQYAAEEYVVEAPMLRPDWHSRYTMAYESDITEDKFNWMNLAYAEHYNLYYIIGTDRETWTEY